MADVTGDALRGLAIPDARITGLWEGQSSYTQADPRPGSVEANSADSRLALATVGDLDTGNAFDILTARGGHAQPGGAGFAWKKVGDGATGYRGAAPPTMITHWESIEWVDGSGGGIQATAHPFAVATSGHSVVCVYQDETTSLKRLRARVRARDGAWGSAVTIYSAGVLVQDYRAGACVLPDDSILCCFWVVDTAANEANVTIYRSTDSGASWSLYADNCLRAGISTDSGSTGFTLGRLRCAYLGGQILLMCDTVSNDPGRAWRDTLHQYASDDLGASFVFIETGAATLFVSHPDVLALSSFLVVYLGATTNINVQYQRRLPDAFTPFSTVEAVTVSQTDVEMGTLDGTNKYASAADQSACIGPAGELYLLNRATHDGTSALNQCCIRRSHDGGESWQGMGLTTIVTYTDFGAWYTNGGDSNTYPTNFCAVAVEGSVLVLTNHHGAPGNEDDSLSALRLGGSSTVTMPGQRAAMLDTNRASWGVSWLPFDVFTDQVWNGIGAATTEAIDAGGFFSFSVTAAQTRHYYIDSSMGGFDALDATQAQGMIARLAVQVTAGGTSGSSDRLYMELRLADGSAGYRVSLRLEATGFALWDTIAGTRIGAAVVASGELDFLVALGAGSAACWYRSRDNKADRVWTAGPSSSSLSDAGGAYATNRVEIGSKATAGSTASMNVYELHIAAGDNAGAGVHGGFTNPGDLFPITYAGAGYSAYVDGGVGLTARGGPAIRGESFAFSSAYGYPVERVRLDESPTPRIKWRSTSAGENTFAFPLDSANTGIESAGYSDTLAVAVLGTNGWRTGKIQGYDAGTTAWVDLADIDTSAGLSFTNSFARIGNTLRPAPVSASTGVYLHENELAGATCIMGGSTYRRVLGNSEGSVIDTGTAGRRASIFLEGIDNTEPTAGITCQFAMPNFVVLVNLLGATYSAYRLLISSQTNVEAYHEVGVLSVGWARYFGHQYSRGRVLETQPNLAVSETVDWITRSSVVSPPRRVVDFAWTDGVLTDQIHRSVPAVPDYVIASGNTGAKAAASARGTPSVMTGLWESMFRSTASANSGIVVYLPSVAPVAASGSDVIMLNRRHEFVVGRIAQPLRIETYTGSESSDEVQRIASISVQEIV